MKKKFIIFSFGLCCGLVHAAPIHLQSDIIKQFDGKSIGINGDVITRIKKYQHEIMRLLQGKKNTTGGRGHYNFEGQFYTIHELRKVEEGMNHTKTHRQAEQFTAALHHMRHDFETVSREFQAAAHGTKPLMAILIDESCKCRNRTDSLLYVWAHTKEENEDFLFDQHIKSIKDFEIFLIDLYNFLEDLAYSCPEANKQFAEKFEKYKQERNEKQEKIRQLFQGLSSSVNEAAFLQFIQRYLDKITLNDITTAKVKSFLSEFNNHAA
jgi:hypothetical protein